MHQILFGPFHSRRLGISLGINLVPGKLCSLDCVYCEAGRTDKLTLRRKEYIPAGKIKEALANYFENEPDPDYFTFSGKGEPTLNTNIGEIIHFIKAHKPSVPVAVLTNGTTLFFKDVRESLYEADVVLPSLDAVSQKIFEKINGPVKWLKTDKIIQGISDFSREFKGKIWLEIFILPGYNDTEEELKAFNEAVKKIRTHKVHLNTLDRPGTRADLRAASKEEMRRAAGFFDFDHVEIIASRYSL